MTKRACLETFGCQMNRLDSELVRSLLEENGYEMTGDVASADLILFNTCSVRRHAEDRVYGRLGMLKRLKEERPEVVIGVLGCMAQKDRERIFEAAPHVDVVLGTREFPALLEYVNRAREEHARQLALGENAALDEVHSHRRLRPNQFQAFVSVMRGCDNFCSYCIVPYVRGREVSRPPEAIVDEVKRLSDQGVIEITLLGQNICSYGKNLNVARPFGAAQGRESVERPPSVPMESGARAPVPHSQGAADLAKLLRLVGAVEGVRRVWFITSHPADMTRGVLEAMRDVPSVCEYLHMPAQSGSTGVLARMNRGCTRERYLELVREARGAVPGVAVASDFIVGFPGETEQDFRETVSLVKECRFSNAFIFKYSPRPGTKAADFADDVPMEVKRRRNQELLSVQERISAEENARFVGRTVEVLIEGPSKTRKDRLIGRARDHRIVIVESEGGRATGGLSTSACVGKIVPVTVTGSTALALYGR